MGNVLNCKKCNKLMRLDDVDFNSEDNKDNYYICDDCDCGAIEKIRFGKTIDVVWSFDD